MGEEANYFKESAGFDAAAAAAKKVAAGKKIDVSLKILEDFYMTDSISRASPTMAKCVQAVKAQKAAPYVTS